MSIRDGERGQSVQIGAVILFAVLVLLLATYQAVAVPAQNRGVEFDHSRAVSGHLQELRSAIVSVASGPGQRSVRVALGTTYPTRVVAVNPPPPTGSLRTVGTADGAVAFAVENATAVGGEAADVWNGTRREYSTGGFVYRPNYNEYRNAPATRYESSVLYAQFGGRTVTRSDQALIDGNRITLVALNGSLSETRAGTAAVDVRSVSASARTVTVRNESAGANVTLRVPTRLDAGTWEDLLSEELADGSVADVRSGRSLPGEFRTVVIELAPGRYELQLAKAGVGTRVTDESAAYAVDVDGDGAAVPEGGTERLVVEVRDRFDNPVSGASVAAATSGPGTLRTNAAQTDDRGRAVLTYEAPDDVDGEPRTARVNATIDLSVAPADRSFDPGAPENLTFDLSVRNSDRSGLGGGGGSAGPYATRWQDPSGQAGVTCSDGPDGVCTVDASRTSEVTLAMATDPVAAGAEVDYALNDTAIGALSPSGGRTDEVGENATTFVPSAEGSVDVYATSGGGGDGLTLEVTNADTGLAYQDDATAEDGPDWGGTAGGVEFTAVNQFGQSLEVTEVKINETRGSVARLNDGVRPNGQPGRSELYVAGDESDGWVDVNRGTDLPRTFDVDSDGFDNNGNPRVSSGEPLTFSLYEFENNGGDQRNMAGESITVTVFYTLADGTRGSTKMEMTVS